MTTTHITVIKSFLEVLALTEYKVQFKLMFFVPAMDYANVSHNHLEET